MELKFQQLNAIGNPEIQVALKLTDDQKGKLGQLAQEFGAKRRELGQDAGQETREKLAKDKKKSVAVLTADQKSQLDKSKDQGRLCTSALQHLRRWPWRPEKVQDELMTPHFVRYMSCHG